MTAYEALDRLEDFELGDAQPEYDDLIATVRQRLQEQDQQIQRLREGLVWAKGYDDGYSECLVHLKAAEARVRELEEDLRDERNDAVQDEQYIKLLKARVRELEAAEARVRELEIENDHALNDYEDAEAIIRQIAEGRPNQRFDPWARDMCAEFIERPTKSRDTLVQRDARVRALQDGLRDPETLARKFHEAYERLAPDFGYETRRDSAVPWEDVPEQNKALMIATVGEVARALLADSEPSYRERRLEEDFYRDPNGQWVYRWSEERRVLADSEDRSADFDNCPDEDWGEGSEATT